MNCNTLNIKQTAEASSEAAVSAQTGGTLPLSEQPFDTLQAITEAKRCLRCKVPQWRLTFDDDLYYEFCVLVIEVCS